MQRQRLGVIAALSAYLIWGLLTIYWRQLHHFNAFELIGWRISSASIVMIIAVSATRRWRLVLPGLRAHTWRITACAVLLATNWTCYVWAVVHEHVLETALGYFISPLFTVLLGVAVLKERLRRLQLAALTLAVAAVVVLTAANGTVPWLALAIAGSWTAYGYLKRHTGLTPLDGMAVESWVLLVPAIAVVAAHWNSQTSIPHSATTVQLVLASLTGVATVAPLMLFAFAAPRVPLTVIGPMLYLVPGINFLLGWLAFGEAMSSARFTGFGLVWASLGVLFIDSTRSGRSESRT
jgi:chloramphenicol-sensitive protein RarD